jgi:hypothetical protein
MMHARSYKIALFNKSPQQGKAGLKIYKILRFGRTGAPV